MTLASETLSAPPVSSLAGRFKWQIAFLLLVICLFGVIRWRLAQMPLERDEGEYAYAGQLMLQHIPPYKFAYNMKLPGTYAGYAALMAVFGETPWGIHIGVLFLNAITVVMIFFLAKRLFGSTAAVTAAATYGLLSTHQKTLGLAGHATHFVVAAAVAALILLLRGLDQERRGILFLSGLFFGLAFLMKQPGALFGAFGFAYVVFASLAKPSVTRSQAARTAGVFFLGCALPFSMTCLVLWWAGVFHSFWFWTFSYARQYSSLISLKDGWDLFTYNFLPMFYAAPALWIIAAIGLSSFAWHKEFRKHSVFVIGLFLFSFLAVSSGLYFRTHYFIMLLPAVGLLTGAAVVSARNALQSRHLAGPVLAIPLIVFILGWGWAIGKNAQFYFRMTPVEACHAVYINSPFVEAIPISDYLRQHTSPTDKIAVLGSEPEIFFYSHRLSATGYIYVYALMENQPYWKQMQQEMIHDIESSRPAYLVYSNHPATWLTTMGSSRLGPFLEWMTAYVKQNYEEVGLVELADPESSFTWGEQSKRKAQTQFYLSIFKRKGQPGE